MQIPSELFLAYFGAVQAEDPTHRLAWQGQPALRRWVDDTLGPVDRELLRLARFLGGLEIAFFGSLGGSVRRVRADEIGPLAARVQGWFGQVLPLDEELPDRLELVEGLEQPELVRALVTVADVFREGAQGLSERQRAILVSVTWVILEALDQAFTPSKDTQHRVTKVHIQRIADDAGAALRARVDAMAHALSASDDIEGTLSMLAEASEELAEE